MSDSSSLLRQRSSTEARFFDFAKSRLRWRIRGLGQHKTADSAAATSGWGRRQDRTRAFELATRPANPTYSVDVGLRDDVRRLLVLEECWNTFGNIGASVRSTRRKIAEAEALAVAVGGEGGPYRVAAVWVVRDAPRLRAVVECYPELFESTFTGNSERWVPALIRTGTSPPDGLGLVWCDPRRGRLTPWRR